MSLFALLPQLGFMELMVLGVLGVLLFGRKLPDVGRYLGQTITSFKKGMKGLEDGVDDVAVHQTSAPAQPVDQIRAPQRVAASAPKFEDVPSTPPQV
ncbi:MAG: twin-arginine translocase TatA/TatE family subunit [Gemmataceae bacterium]|nr:twin-arginine translocase TatA/TatE family subunit [Gemmataceae bacterium]